MQQSELFKLALGLHDPWEVTGISFDKERSRLDLHLDFSRGSRFSCPECAANGCPVHDTEDKEWRHLDFFQHEAYLHARVPRVRCEHHGVRLVDVPWARAGSGFTLLFEALLLQFSSAMPVSKVAELFREHDTRVWRVLEHYVHLLRENQDYSDVTKVGFDETSSRKGHNYVSVFMDLDKGNVLYATEGKDCSTIERFVNDLENHNGKATSVTDVSIDMSSAFIVGVQQHIACAEITFDRFHVMKKLSEALDQVRRSEQADNPVLKKTRYIWLRNENNLTKRQRETLAWLTRPSMRLQTSRAHRWMQDFKHLYSQPTEQEARSYLDRWCKGAMRSRLQPIKDFVQLVRNHYDGILAWHTSRISNGLLEGTNSLIQAAKARARGYRSVKKMITIIYLIAAKLPLPTLQKPLSVTHSI